MKTRPTGSMIRESLFNILADRVNGAVVLDLFSGSGALGLEALSRGASAAVFVDNSKKCCDIIRQNVALLGFDSKAEVIRRRVQEIVRWEKEVIGRFGAGQVGLVFADPPYSCEDMTSLPGSIAASPVLSEEALVVFEHGDDVDMPNDAGGFEKYKAKSYGGTGISIYRKCLCH